MVVKKASKSIPLHWKVKTALSAGNVRLDLQRAQKGRSLRSVVAIGRDGAVTALAEKLRLSERPNPVEIAAAYSIFAPFEGLHLCQKINSYVLKHLVERKLKIYISNGACQTAAAMAGFSQVFDESTNSKIYAPVAMLRELGAWTRRKPNDSRDEIITVYEDPTQKA